MEILIVILVALFAIVIFALWVIWWMRRRVIRLGRDFIDAMVGHISSHVSRLPKVQQILEYDKILDKTLGELGYQGTLAEKLKKYQHKLAHPEAVWAAHRERNKIVHEIGYTPPHADTDRHVAALEREVMKILKQGKYT